MFFHIFNRQLTNILEIETAVIGPKHGSGGRQKTNKTNKKNYFFAKKYCKSMSDTYSKPRAKISFKMLFSHENVGSAQWTLH